MKSSSTDAMKTIKTVSGNSNVTIDTTTSGDSLAQVESGSPVPPIQPNQPKQPTSTNNKRSGTSVISPRHARVLKTHNSSLLNQTYVVLNKPNEVHRDVLFRFGKFCYRDTKMDLGVKVLTLNNFSVVLKVLQQRQGSMPYLCREDDLDSYPDFMKPMDDALKVAKFCSTELQRCEEKLKNLTKSAENSWMNDDFDAFFLDVPMTTAKIEEYKNIELVVSKMIIGNINWCVVYNAGKFLITFNDAHGQHELLDQKFPNISNPSKEFCIETYTDQNVPYKSLNLMYSPMSGKLGVKSEILDVSSEEEEDQFDLEEMYKDENKEKKGLLFREGYSQTYIVRRPRGTTTQRKVFARCGNWCYNGQVDMGQNSFEISEISIAVPILQAQQGNLQFLSEFSKLSRSSSYRRPLIHLTRVAECIQEQAVTVACEEALGKLKRLDNEGGGGDEVLDEYFDLELAESCKIYKNIEFLASKTYIRGIILFLIYYDGHFYCTAADGEGDHPLLDVNFPDLSKHSGGQMISELDHPSFKKFSVWLGGAGKSKASKYEIYYPADRKNLTNMETFKKQIEKDHIKQRTKLTERQELTKGKIETHKKDFSAERQQKISMLPKMVAGVTSSDPKEQFESTTQLRKLLSIEKNPPIQEVIKSGVLPRLIEFLQCHNKPPLQFEAAWALTNIASGTSDHARAVIEAGAVPIFVKLLSSPNADVQEQAVWALGNIAGDSPQCRNLVLQAGVLQPLLAQLNSDTKLSMLRNGTWTLSNLCRGKPQPEFSWVSPALKTLNTLIFQLDDEVLADACWALSYLSDGPNEKIAAVIESGVTVRLVELLMHPSPAVQVPALRTVGNIVTGDDLQTQMILNCSVLPALLSMLSSVKKGIKKEAAWTISNITAGNKDQIQAVIEANIMPPLIHLLSHAEWDIKKEAAWAISNATSSGTPVQIEYLVQHGCIPPLCDLLTVQDNKIVTVALEGLENILKVGQTAMREKGLPENPCAQHVENAGGLDKIDALQQHEDIGIYEKSLRILERYFGAVDESIVSKDNTKPAVSIPPLIVFLNQRKWKEASEFLKQNLNSASEKATISIANKKPETPLRIAINNGAPVSFLKEIVAANTAAIAERGTNDELLPVECVSKRCEFFQVVPEMLAHSMRFLWISLPKELKTLKLGREVFCSHIGATKFLLNNNDQLVAWIPGWQWNEIAQWAAEQGNKEVAALVEAHALTGGNTELRDLKLAQEADVKNAEKLIEAQIATTDANDEKETKSILPQLQGIIQQAIELGGCTPWRRAKLMVVGQGRAGKSTTIDSLRGRKFQPQKESTVGAQVDDECVVDRRAVQNWEDVEDHDTHEQYKKALNRIAADKMMGKQTMLDQSAEEALEIRNNMSRNIRDSLGGEDGCFDDNTERQTDQSSKMRNDTEDVDMKDSNHDDNAAALMFLGSTIRDGDVSSTKNKGIERMDSLSSNIEDSGTVSFRTSSNSNTWGRDDDAAKLVDEGLFNMRQSSQEEEDDKITFSIWDFGGQRVFYSLHHAFLTRLGCYIVVFRMTDVIMRKNPTAEEHERFTESWEFLRFWTRSIAMHARGAPVLFVGTHKDVITSDTEHMDISEQLNRFLLPMGMFHDLDVQTFDNGTGMPLLFFPINNTISSKDPVLTELRAAIDTAVREDSTDYLHHKVPLPWLKLHDELKSSGNPYVHLADVENLARNCNIPKSEVAPALMFLHELGVLLFYNEPVLREVLILNPQWMVDAISRVVRQWGQINDTEQLHLHPAQREISRYFADEYEIFLETAVLSEPLLKVMIEGADTRRTSSVASPKTSTKSLKGKSEDESQFKGQYLLVVKLMKKFGLLCDWPSHDEEISLDGEVMERVRRFFVPSLLPERIEEVNQNGELLSALIVNRDNSTKSGTFSLVFDKFIPDGMWERLACLAVGHSACLGSKTPVVSRKEADLSFGEVEIVMIFYPELNRINVTVYNAVPVVKASKEEKDGTNSEDMPGSLRNILVMMRDMATDIANEFFSKRWAKRINVMVESKVVAAEHISVSQATGVIAPGIPSPRSAESKTHSANVQDLTYEYDFKLLERASQRGDKVLWAQPTSSMAKSTASPLRTSPRNRKSFSKKKRQEKVNVDIFQHWFHQSATVEEETSEISIKSTKDVAPKRVMSQKLGGFKRTKSLNSMSMLRSVKEEPDTTSKTSAMSKSNRHRKGARLVALPKSKDGREIKHHFFLSHYQATGGDIAMNMHFQLQMRGFSSWYDMTTEDLDAAGMADGVRCAGCVLLILTKGVLARQWVQFEIAAAVEHKVPILMIYEADQRRAASHWDFSEQGSAPAEMEFLFNNEEAPEWCPKTCKEALPYQRRTYLVTAMVEELSRKAKFPRSRMTSTPRVTPKPTPVPLPLKNVLTAGNEDAVANVSVKSLIKETNDISLNNATPTSDGACPPVESWLKEQNLGMYWSKLLKDGYDSLDLIPEITAEDLDNWGFKKGHKIKMLKAVAKYACNITPH